MKKLLAILFLLLAVPAIAAENPAPDKGAPEKSNEKNAQKQEAAPKPGEYVCPYYTVNLPTGWQAILPPTDNLGQVSAVFAKNSQNPSITMTIAKTGGVSLKTIAEMFAEQFQAPRKPALKNGQYIFSYTQNNVPNQVWVATDGPFFMITAIGGNQAEGLDFIKNYVKSENYSSLLPR